MIGSPNELERTASMNILAANYSKQPLVLKDFEQQSKFVAGILSGSLNPSQEGFGTRLKTTLNTLSPLDPKKASERFDYTDEILESVLNGTTKQQKAVAAQGGLDTVTQILAKEGATIVNPAKAQEHADNLARLGSKAISAEIAKITTKSATALEGSTQRGYASLATPNPLDNYGVSVGKDGLSLKLVLTTKQPTAPKRDANVEALNEMINNHLESFNQLGMDEDFKRAFINDILTSLSISPSNIK